MVKQGSGRGGFGRPAHFDADFAIWWPGKQKIVCFQ